MRNFLPKHFLALGVLLLFCVAVPIFADDTNTVASTAPAAPSAADQEILRSYLQIQEQLHTTQQQLEKNRQDAEIAAARSAVLLDERFKLVEKTIASQHLDDLKGFQRSDRSILVASGIFLAAGFLILISAGLLQWSAMNRLGAVMSKLTQLTTLPMIEASTGSAKGLTALEESTSRFLKLMDRLEHRVTGLENGASIAAFDSLSGDVNQAELPEIINHDASPAASKNRAVALLLGKGQSLLKLDQAQAALNCFDEVLALDPANAEALLKKGAALERLQRFDEAVGCYDRAIARDGNMTMAYLYKGGVFNRMERHTEALECYEQALKTRQKDHEAAALHLLNGAA